MEDIVSWIQTLTGLSQSVLLQIGQSLLIVLVLWALRSLTVQLVWRRTEDAQTRYHWQKGTTYLAAILGLLFITRVWFTGLRSMATFLGLVTAGFAIALQDLVRGMAAWVFILWRRPFSVGDRIQVGKYAGDVIDIRLFKFTLMEIGNWVDAEQSTGRVIHVPNGSVLTDVVANYSTGLEFIWNEIPVLVTFESDWEAAKELLSEIGERHASHLSAEAQARVQEASKRYMIFYSNLTPMVYTSVRDCGVLLTLRYLIEPRKRRGSEQAIWEEILRAFSQRQDMDFAYPTQRFYDNVAEGKEGARAKPLG